MCATLLADLGATVIRVERRTPVELGPEYDAKYNLLDRNRSSIAVDLADPNGVASVLRLIDQSDALIDPFRPGVAERLGIGPEVCMTRNPRLVYGRITGWGQQGPLAHQAGHDINYIALSGALACIGMPGRPPIPPLNLIGDGAGGVYLAFGICAAIIERQSSGNGQIIDAAMVDAASSLMTPIYGLKAAGCWPDERGIHPLTGAAHFYTTYETLDGKWIAVGAVEKRFHTNLLAMLGLTADDIPDQWDETRWPEYKERLGEIFRRKPRHEWINLMANYDACVSPVLSLDEAPVNPQLAARGTFVTIDGVVQPASAPRFSRTPGGVTRPPSDRGADTVEALVEWGFTSAEIDALRAHEVI